MMSHELPSSMDFTFPLSPKPEDQVRGIELETRVSRSDAEQLLVSGQELGTYLQDLQTQGITVPHAEEITTEAAAAVADGTTRLAKLTPTESALPTATTLS